MADGFFQAGLVGLGKARAEGTNESDRTDFFGGGGQVEAGNLFLPKAEPGKSAEFSVKVRVGVSALFWHREASVWRRANSSPPSARTRK